MTTQRLTKLSDRLRHLAWVVFLALIVVGFIGSLNIPLWWIGLFVAVVGFLIAIGVSTYEMIKEGME